MKYLTLLLALLSFSLFAEDIYQEKMDARIRTTYEVIPLSSTQDIGVIGTHFDWYPLESL